MKKDKRAHIPKLYNDYSCKAFTYIKNFCSKLQYINEEKIVTETHGQTFWDSEIFYTFQNCGQPKELLFM